LATALLWSACIAASTFSVFLSIWRLRATVSASSTLRIATYDWSRTFWESPSSLKDASARSSCCLAALRSAGLNFCAGPWLALEYASRAVSRSCGGMLEPQAVKPSAPVKAINDWMLRRFVI
jgi:hypothetical protein